MKPQAALTMAAAGMLVLTAIPATATDWSMQQLQLTDGYATVNYAEPNRGAAGRAGQVPAHDSWLDEQLQRTDGYFEPAAATPPASLGTLPGA